MYDIRKDIFRAVTVVVVWGDVSRVENFTAFAISGCLIKVYVIMPGHHDN